MPSGDNYSVTNTPRESFDLNVGNGDLDNETPVSNRKFGHITAPVKYSSDHIDFNIDPMISDSVSTKSGSTSTKSGSTSAKSTDSTLTESTDSTSTENVDGMLTDYDDAGLVFVNNDSDESLPIRPKSEEPKPEPPRPLKNRKVTVRTGTGAFLGAIGGVAGLGIAAASSGAVVAKLALIGAAVGTLVTPGVGTVAGAAIGAAIGAIAVGGTGAAVGALLVKAGGWFKSNFGDQQAMAAVQEFARALFDIKNERAFGSETFRRLAVESDIRLRGLESHRQEIDEAFRSIINKFEEPSWSRNWLGQVKSPPVPTQDFADAALVGLMKIYDVPPKFDFNVDIRFKVSLRDQITDKFIEFLGENPNADAEIIGAIADAYANILESEELGGGGRETAVETFATALAARASQAAKQGNALSARDVAAIAASARKSASIEYRISGQTFDLYSSEAFDLGVGDLAAAWRNAVYPLVQRGQPIDESISRAVLDPLRNLYEREAKPCTKRNFERFLADVIAGTGTLDPSVTQRIELNLSGLETNLKVSDGRLNRFQEKLVDWAQDRVANNLSVTQKDINQYMNENF